MKNVADMTNIYNNLRKYLGTLDIENISGLFKFKILILKGRRILTCLCLI
jgi:hypothetical protein